MSLFATVNRTPTDRLQSFEELLRLEGNVSLTPNLCEALREARRSVLAPTYTKPPLTSLGLTHPATLTRGQLPAANTDPSGRRTCGLGALRARRRKPSCHPGNGSQVLGVTVLPRSGWTSVRVKLCAVGCTLNRNRKNCRPVTWPEVTSVEGVLVASAASVVQLFYSFCLKYRAFG